MDVAVVVELPSSVVHHCMPAEVAAVVAGEAGGTSKGILKTGEAALVVGAQTHPWLLHISSRPAAMHNCTHTRIGYRPIVNS